MSHPLSLCIGQTAYFTIAALRPIFLEAGLTAAALLRLTSLGALRFTALRTFFPRTGRRASGLDCCRFLPMRRPLWRSAG